MNGNIIRAVSSRKSGKPERTLLIHPDGDGCYGSGWIEWEPDDFSEWYCDDEAGILYIYDCVARVIAQYELSRLSEIIFITDGQE